MRENRGALWGIWLSLLCRCVSFPPCHTLKRLIKNCSRLVSVCEGGFVLKMASKWAPWGGLRRHNWVIEKQQTFSLCMANTKRSKQSTEWWGKAVSYMEIVLERGRTSRTGTPWTSLWETQGKPKSVRQDLWHGKKFVKDKCFNFPSTNHCHILSILQ